MICECDDGGGGGVCVCYIGSKLLRSSSREGPRMRKQIILSFLFYFNSFLNKFLLNDLMSV